MNAFVERQFARRLTEKLVDRLLASPHYGERWAQNGSIGPLCRHQRLRDSMPTVRTPGAIATTWSMRSIEDKPYDRFIKEQIAGDELFRAIRRRWSPPAICGPDRASGGGEHRSGGEPPGSAHRDRDLGWPDFHGPDRQLRALPQPQVRPDPAGRLLPAAGGLRDGAKGKDIEIATPEQKAAWEAATRRYKAAAEADTRRVEAIWQSRIAKRRSGAAGQARAEAAGRFDMPEDKRTPEQKILATECQRRRSSPTWDEVVAAMTPET